MRHNFNKYRFLSSNAVQTMKQWLPSSMAAQMILTVLLAIIMAQLLSFIILGSAYQTVFSEIDQKSQFQHIESLTKLLEQSDTENYLPILNASRTQNNWFTLTEKSILPSVWMDRREQRLSKQLQKRLGKHYLNRVRVQVIPQSTAKKNTSHHASCSYSSKSYPSHKDTSVGYCSMHERYHNRPTDHSTSGTPQTTTGKTPSRRPLTTLTISVQLPTKSWLNLQAKASLPPPLIAWQTLVFLLLSIVFVLLALLVMIRRITRPLSMLAKASDALGTGKKVNALSEKGPDDIKKTIHAFNRMNKRLQRFVEDRIRMLAALSHDLRTPITTLLLRVELMPKGKDRNHLLATLEEMKQMSEATLAFMRQSSDNEATCPLALNAMLGSLCDDLAELGQAVTFTEGNELVIHCRPVSLKRAIRNLIENAVKYGKKANVHFFTGEDKGQPFVTVVIEDQGPGIPNHQKEQVFEPFFRLEKSRNRNTGGMGLGMAIARNIVRNHGGDIVLHNKKKGLMIHIILPL
ncbi:Osmolarity sensor protein EnvZ [invertebrate metagenome]|uniref:histidine kinase n=1 Tax=invertebrate metagenome TaxID=1711999 RepID=A0A2H9T5F7_9ZZZZ